MEGTADGQQERWEQCYTLVTGGSGGRQAAACCSEQHWGQQWCPHSCDRACCVGTSNRSRSISTVETGSLEGRRQQLCSCEQAGRLCQSSPVEAAPALI